MVQTTTDQAQEHVKIAVDQHRSRIDRNRGYVLICEQLFNHS